MFFSEVGGDFERAKLQQYNKRIKNSLGGIGMKKLTRRRMFAFLLMLSLILSMFGFDCHVEASEVGEQMDGAAKLAVPKNVREENGFIVWDEVEEAYGYTIQAEKDGETWEYNWYENQIEWNRFIFEHCSMRDFGNYAFQVCAFDETGAATEFSSSVTVSYQATLSVPTNVKVSESNSSLSWDEVEGAVRYNIRVYKNDKDHSLDYSTYTSSFGYWFGGREEESLITVQAMDRDYHVSEWTEEVLIEAVEKTRLETPQNVRFDESGKNIIWDGVEGADGYEVLVGSFWERCEQPILVNWQRYISPYSGYNGEQSIQVYATGIGNMDSEWSESFEFEYTPIHDESIVIPPIKLENGYITWGEAENAFQYIWRIMINGDVCCSDFGRKEFQRECDISRYPEGDYEIELCVVDEEGSYNSKIYPFTLDTAHDESVWVPKLYHKFETVLWDYDRLRHPDTDAFWVRIRRQRDGAFVDMQQQGWEYYYGLMDLKNGDYMLDVCTCERGWPDYNYILGKWSEPMEIEKHGDGLFEEENESTEEVEGPPEADYIPEEDRITSITINPAFNMKHKDGNNVELDLSKIKIKAKEIYDEEGLKRAEAALGETLKGNKHYNLLDLTLLYNGKDFSNGYDGLVKVIIPLPKGHRDKTFSCYRLTESDGKVTKEIIPGEQTEDSYIIYLEHFSEYALVAAGPEESEEPENPEEPQETEKPHTHSYGSDWKSDTTGHWKECACKDRAEENAHTQDAGTVTKEATKTEPGIKTYQCSVCGYVMKTEEIAKLPADEEPVGNQVSISSKITKDQKKKNEVLLNKKISSKVSRNTLSVAWKKLSAADGYDIFAAPCSDDFKGITVSVGKNRASATIRKINGRKINGKETYKVKVKAYRLLENGKKQYIGTSAVMHVAGSRNKTSTNAKNIRLKQKAYDVRKGQSAQIRATIIKADRKKKLLSKSHGAKLSYVSSDEKIAVVTATGKIKAKKHGRCTIYVRALNGISKEIKVTVN